MNYEVKCPPDCPNTDFGTCPRCYANTGLGCPHGDLCEECAAEAADWPAIIFCDICDQNVTATHMGVCADCWRESFLPGGVHADETGDEGAWYSAREEG